MKLSELNQLHFEPVASQKFPCLQLAYKAAEMGGVAPAVLNGANEVVVESYLKEQIHFLDIARIIEKTIEQFSALKQNSNQVSSFLKEIKTIDDALNADNWGRQTAKSFLN